MIIVKKNTTSVFCNNAIIPKTYYCKLFEFKKNYFNYYTVDIKQLECIILYDFSICKWSFQINDNMSICWYYFLKLAIIVSAINIIIIIIIKYVSFSQKKDERSKVEISLKESKGKKMKTIGNIATAKDQKDNESIDKKVFWFLIIPLIYFQSIS